MSDDGRQDWASVRRSTNNRMELTAVLELLLAVPTEPLLIQSDSQYVVNVFTEWLPKWRNRGMRTSDRRPIENLDLIEQIESLIRGRDIQWEWVRGHDGHGLNEAADDLARFGAERSKLVAETGSLPRSGIEPRRMHDRPAPHG